MIIASPAGAGKSVIWYDIFPIVHSRELMLLASSAIIEDIRPLQKSGLASLAFFYCDFRDDQKKDCRGLLSSLLVQLCEQSNAYSATLSDFYAIEACLGVLLHLDENVTGDTLKKFPLAEYAAEH